MKIKDSIILIVVFVVAIFLGVFIGVKVTDGKSDNNKQPNQTENNDSKTTELSTAEAEEIMSKYKLSGEYAGFHRRGNYYISSLNNENEMNLLAIQSTDKTLVTNCDDVKENEFAYFICTDKEHKREVYLYKYDDVLTKKMELFGSSSTLSKEQIYNVGDSYNYISKLNGYVNAPCMCGADPTTYNSTIVKAVRDDLELIVELNVDIDDYDEGTSNHRYKYVFKKTNNNYYLAEITEVK